MADLNTTTADSLDDPCRTRLLSSIAVFLVYALILAFKLRQVLSQKRQVECALKSEKLYSQWLIHHYPPPNTLNVDYRPPGPREDDCSI